MTLGNAYAVAGGRLTGNVEEASNFLSSLSPRQRKHRSKMESRARGKVRKRPYKLGERPQ